MTKIRKRSNQEIGAGIKQQIENNPEFHAISKGGSDLLDSILVSENIVYSFSPKWEIGDRAYHATMDSDMGIIINIVYDVRATCIKYQISFSQEGDGWYFEEELSTTKVIV